MIEARGLGKVYKDGARNLEILKDVSFTVQKGEGLSILGPSGSGKTTLLNLLSGLDRPTSGEVWLNGKLLSALSESQKNAIRNREIGFVFQFYHLLSEFTALENVLLPCLLLKDETSLAQKRQRAETLIDRVGLKNRSTHFPAELSGGEKQRVAIARALMNEPDILFCDEPTGNLDAVTGQTVIELLTSFFREGKKTVIIVTHDERIAKMADRVWRIA